MSPVERYLTKLKTTIVALGRSQELFRQQSDQIFNFFVP